MRATVLEEGLSSYDNAMTELPKRQTPPSMVLNVGLLMAGVSQLESCEHKPVVLNFGPYEPVVAFSGDAPAKPHNFRNIIRDSKYSLRQNAAK